MKVTVMIPTYNERGNIAPLVEEVLRQSPDIDVLVVDDHSPDGTGQIVADIARANPRVKLFDRAGPRGRGRAGREGFVRALESGTDFVIEMDGDFSHAPRYIPALLEKAREFPVVLGSRFVASAGGGDIERTWLRRLTSLLAGCYIRAMLGFKGIADPTSGYRCFSRAALQAIDVGTTRANDPFIVTEILFRCRRRGLAVAEVPIVFENRREGKSKLGLKILLTNLLRVAALRISGWTPPA